MPDNNAAKSVHQYLLAENIHIDLEEFTFQAKTHPDYPSVLAYSDTLHFFGVNNKAVRLDHTQLEALPQQFIALMVDFDEQEMLAFVQRKNDVFQYVKNGKWLRLNHTQFAKEWKGVILLVEGQAEPIKPKVTASHKNVALLLGGFLLLLLGLYGANGLTALGVSLLALNVAGLYLSVLAVSAELGINDGKQPLFCKDLPMVDCNAVITSDRGRLFKFIKFTDACIVFFSAQLLALLFFGAAGWLNIFYAYTLVALVAALPLTFYSLYLQRVIEKKWCTICLTITGLLYLQLGIMVPVLLGGFATGSLWQLITYAALFTTVFAGWMSIKALLQKNKTLKQAHHKALTFKRNYDLFRYALLQSRQIDMATANQAIVLGSNGAALSITLVTNPFCSHCAGAHKVLEQLLKSYGDDVSIAIRFNYTDRLDAEQQQLHHQLVTVYQQKGAAAFTEALGAWFTYKDHTKWTAAFASKHVQADASAVDWLQQQAAWNHSQGLNFTPAFLIGPYLYPMTYEREDLLYFIADLIEDESLSLANPSIL